MPVPLNTLLTPTTTRYLLRDIARARARRQRRAAAASSRRRSPTCRRCARRGRRRAQPARRRRRRARAVAHLVDATAPRAGYAATTPDDVAFWLYSSGSTGKPKGAMHLHAHLIADRARSTREACSASRADDVVFSAAKLFFAYGLGNALTFPLSVGATAVLLRRAPDAGGGAARVARRIAPTIFCGVPTLFASAARRPGADARPVDRAARVDVGRRGAAEARRRALARALRQRHPRRHRLDRDAAHLPVEPARRRRATARPASRSPATTSSCAATTARRSPTARRARCGCAARPRAPATGTIARASLATFHGPWTRTGDRYVRDADGYYTYSRPRRRHAEGRRHLGVAVRGRVGARRRTRRCSRRRSSATTTPTG